MRTSYIFQTGKQVHHVIHFKAENPLESPLIPHVDTRDKVKRGLKLEFLKFEFYSAFNFVMCVYMRYQGTF